MIKAFNLCERLATEAREFAQETKHLVWRMGNKEISLTMVIEILQLKGGCQEKLALLIQNNPNQEELAAIKKDYASIIKRCNSAQNTAEYLAKVANNPETQEIDPRIIKLFPKLQTIREKINSGEFKKLGDSKLASYIERLDSFSTEKRVYLNHATLNSVNEAKVIAKDLEVKFERMEIMKQILEMFNGEDESRALFNSLKKMITLISSNETGEEFAKTAADLSKLEGLFAMDDAEGKNANVLHRIYHHLYHILENKQISISGVKKSDLDFGEKVFKSNESSIQITKLRAVRRVAIELLLSELKEAIQNNSMEYVFGSLIALERIENQLKDRLGEENAVHNLFGKHYQYCKENDPNKYGCDAQEWGTEFGRIAAVLGNNKILSNEARLAILQNEMNCHKEKWVKEDSIVN